MTCTKCRQRSDWITPVVEENREPFLPVVQYLCPVCFEKIHSQPGDPEMKGD